MGPFVKKLPLSTRSPCCSLCSERTPSGRLSSQLCLGCSLPMTSTHRCHGRPAWRTRCDSVTCQAAVPMLAQKPEDSITNHSTWTTHKAKTPSGQSASVNGHSCGQEGHYAHERTERRTFRQNFPTSPFIYYYDNK